MKYLLLLSCLLLLTCAEEATVETTVPALAEKARDTIFVPQLVPQPAAAPAPESFTTPSPARECPFSVIVNKMYMTLHLGVDNLVQVKGTGYGQEPYRVTASGASIRHEIGDFYIVNPGKHGRVVLTVNTSKGEALWEVPFYTRLFPDIKLKIRNMSSGDMTLLNFIDSKVISSWNDSELPDLGFDCYVIDFRLRRITQDGSITAVLNQGQRFSGETQDLVSAARLGDIYIFDRATLRCPGDQTDRLGNTLVFDII